MGSVALDFSKAQPLPQQPVTLDFSKAQPIKTQPPQAPQEGFWHSLGAQFGLTPEAAKAALQDEKDHPIKSFLLNLIDPAGFGRGIIGQAKQSAGELGQAYSAAKENNPAAVAQHTITAVPVVGPALAKGADQYAQGDYAGEAGTLLGASAQAAPMVAGAVDAAVPNRPAIPNPSLPNLKSKIYPTSQSLAPDVSAARNLSKALVVDPAGVNNFVKSAADEAGTVVGYAKEKGLPINSKVDFANAAKQTADAAQSHYDENILAPNAKRVTAVPASYQGPTVGEGNNATLGAINDRINAINSELKSNFRKPLQAQTSAANTSDAELLSEKNALTNVLHNKLADATGLPPEAIADLRQQAGKLRTIADESQLSANRDLTAAGRQGMGATTTSSIGTKAGLIDRTLQAVQGGPEVIGNRQILSALKRVAPKPLDLPQPTPAEVTPPAPRPPTGGPSTTISGPNYTPDPSAVAGLRDKISARQAAPIKQMQQWANNGAAKLVQHDPNLTTADIEFLNKSTVGKQILIKASSLAPGSPAMENLFPQIHAALSAK